MTGRLAGKTAIVTGGGQGIGEAAARRFAREGANVLITGRTAEKLEKVVDAIRAEGGEASSMVATVGVRADAEATIAKAVALHGTIDILVNNAQTLRSGVSFDEHDDALFDLTLQSGLYGTLQHMQAALPYLKKKGGSVINFGSREGLYGGLGFAAYASTKEAIRGLTRTSARELGKFGIRVNVICPAAMSPAAAAYLDTHPEEREMYLREIAAGYFGNCDEDIAPVILFLASDDSKYVSGQTINVDGGNMML